jgi:hypothetical protein
MPGRIPVVLSQASAAGADARRLEEDLIAALMFERGVDVSVVPHLTQLNDGTTGLLCLEGIKGDLIVLTWLEPEHARRLLDQRGVRGREWLAQPAQGVGLSRSAATSAAPRLDRRLHILQLDAAAPTAHYVQEIQRLREDNRVSNSVARHPARDHGPPAGRHPPGRAARAGLNRRIRSRGGPLRAGRRTADHPPCRDRRIGSPIGSTGRSRSMNHHPSDLRERPWTRNR